MTGSEPTTDIEITNVTEGDIGVVTVKGGQLTLPLNSVLSADPFWHRWMAVGINITGIVFITTEHSPNGQERVRRMNTIMHHNE